MFRSLPRVERLNITESDVDGRLSTAPGFRTEELSPMHKKSSLTVSISRRLEGLVAIVLAISVLVFLAISGRTLYQFPVADGFRWYGDEMWMLLGWKTLLTHGRMAVPVALSSQLLFSPGLLLGSQWVAAFFYGIPQLLVSGGSDIVDVGRTVSFVLGLSILGLLMWAAYRFGIRMSIAVLTIALLATTRNFTFATHSARYDIMTGFALLAFVCAAASLLSITLKIFDVKYRNLNWVFFLIGSSGVILSFGVSPHLEALLPMVVLYSAWYLGAFRSVKGTVFFTLGCMVTTILLVTIYTIANHSFSMAGALSTENQFGSVMSTLPYHHLFSWSAQRHQLWAKGYYLLHEAPLFAVVLPFVLISELVLLVTHRVHRVTGFVTGCLLLSLTVALFVQGTLPYYPVHVLPLIALAFALHLKTWGNVVWVAPVVAVASVALSVAILLHWTPELSRAGRIAKRISEANTAAIQAAFEKANVHWEPGSAKPLVLAQAPAIHELLRDRRLRVMSESFLFFPLSQNCDLGTNYTDSIVSREGVAYVLDYNKPMTHEYQMAIRKGTPIFTRIGPLLDRTVDYFQDTTSESDTLTLYQMNISK